MKLSKRARTLAGLNGDPTKPTAADSTRLANATQAQIAELIEQGYLPYSTQPVLDKAIERRPSRADRGFFASNSLDVSDIEKAIIKKPWLGRSLIHTRTLDAYDLSSGFFEDVLDSIEKFSKEANLASIESKVSEVRELISGDDNEFPGFAVQSLLTDLDRAVRRQPEVGEYGHTPNAALDKAKADKEKVAQRSRNLNNASPEGSFLRVGDSGYTVNPVQNSEGFTIGGNQPSGDYYSEVPNPGSQMLGKSQFVSAMSLANPGAIDYDEYLSLLSQGYMLFDDSFLQESSFTADRAAAQARNLGRNVYNTLFGGQDEVEVIDKGDLGRETRVTEGEKLQLESVPGSKISGFTNIYPVLRTDIRVSPQNPVPFTDQREMLEDGFFLDREAAGTGAVRRDDLQKTLFNEKITPGRKLQFYNEELGDIVDIFSYDTPEFMDQIGGGESGFDQNTGGGGGQQEEGGGGGGGEAVITPPSRMKPLKKLQPNFSIEKALRQLKGDKNKPSLPFPDGVRLPIQVGALNWTERGVKQGGQELDREYYWDAEKKKWREREVDAERKGGPVYGGKYAFEFGGRVKAVKKAKEGMRLKKAKQGMVIGDPKKHQDKIRALGRNNEVMYIPAGEGAMDDPENYLNLSRLDSILDTSNAGDLPFSAFRDQVRRVEAGPGAKDPYGTIQEVNVLDDDGNIIGKEPVRKELQPQYGSGAYQLDYPTATTAYNRLKAIADKRDLDYPMLTDQELMYPSSLPPEIQDMLFTAHFAVDKLSSVEKVKTSKDNWADQWYKGHYKGSDLGRLEHFKSLQ